VDVVGELPDGAEVGFLGALAQAGELEVLAHPFAELCRLTQCRGRRNVLSQRSKETPLRRTLCAGTASRQRSADRRNPP
jgi:hypothetical protein